MSTAEDLISRARHGAFQQVLPELLAVAGDSADPCGWMAAAAAVQILFWEDRFAEAAQLVEELIVSTAPSGGEICDQDFPFDTAFIAAQIHAGIEAVPRMRRAAASAPEASILRQDLLWQASSLAERSALSLLPDASDWGGRVNSLEGVIGAELVERDYGELSARQKRVVWMALNSANDFPGARRLMDSSGERPEQYAVCVWMAGWYAAEGEIHRGEEMLLAAHDDWWPYATWDAIPDSMVLHPTLRRACTERVREYYLTRPIGPEAEKVDQ